MDRYLKFARQIGCDVPLFQRIQKRLLEMAVSVDAVLVKHEIPYFLCYGSLLGAVRHGGFIPWDDDFDLCLLDEDYARAVSALKADLPSDLLVEDAETEPRFFHGWARIKDKKTVVHNQLAGADNCYRAKGLNLDLFRAKRLPASRFYPYRKAETLAYLKRKLDKGLFTPPQYREAAEAVCRRFQPLLQLSADSERPVIALFDRPIIEPEWIFPLCRLPFDGVPFLAPANPDRLLKAWYGDYRQLPAPEAARSHFDSVEFLESV